MASDSSSSGGSDSDEEEEKADIVTETISTGSGQETIKLTMDAKNEKAVFTRCERNFLGLGSCSALCAQGLMRYCSLSDTMGPNVLGEGVLPLSRGVYFKKIFITRLF